MTRAADFLALFVTGIDPDGTPRLAGTNRRVLATCAFGQSDIGRQAVCQVAQDGSVIVAFGVLRGKTDTDAPETPIEITCGAAGLRLDPDGRITLRGTRMEIRTSGPFRLDAARVDLN